MGAQKQPKKKTQRADRSPSADGKVDDRAAGAEVERLKAALEAKSKERDELEKQLQYLAADYDNLTKRLARERERYRCQAAETIFMNLLGFLDNFDQAVGAAGNYLEMVERGAQEEPGRAASQPGTEPDSAQVKKPAMGQKGLAQGLVKLYQSLMQILKAQGLEVIPTVGLPFDTAQHEAVLTRESGEHAENTVLVEVQKGYKLGNRVLRPAKVIVSTSPLVAPNNGEDGTAADDGASGAGDADDTGNAAPGTATGHQ